MSDLRERLEKLSPKRLMLLAMELQSRLDTIERERSVLIAAIDSFASQGAACCTGHRHPFFGPLKPEQWAILMYKHVDHHLRQFGV